MESLEIVYRDLVNSGGSVDSTQLLADILADLNQPWFVGDIDLPTSVAYNDRPLTALHPTVDPVSARRTGMLMAVVTKCHKGVADLADQCEPHMIMSLIDMSRRWESISGDMEDSPAKHLLRWNAMLIQSALLEAFRS